MDRMDHLCRRDSRGGKQRRVEEQRKETLTSLLTVEPHTAFLAEVTLRASHLPSKLYTAPWTVVTGARMGSDAGDSGGAVWEGHQRIEGHHIRPSKGRRSSEGRGTSDLITEGEEDAGGAGATKGEGARDAANRIQSPKERRTPEGHGSLEGRGARSSHWRGEGCRFRHHCG